MIKTQNRGKSVLILLLVMLSFVIFSNPITVKADTLYRVTVKTSSLYVDDDTYDPNQEEGEFEFQCSFSSSHSPAYLSSEWSMETYSTRNYTETLYNKKWMDDSMYIFFCLEENDIGDDDIVIDWQSKPLSYFNVGNNKIRFDDATGLQCVFLIIKQETGIEGMEI
jgi:hypothetical protein